jgi:hypothetical protein
MIFLVDHNLEGQALFLSGSITNQGWQELLPIRFILLKDTSLPTSLPVDGSDRVVWRFAPKTYIYMVIINDYQRICCSNISLITV